MRESFPDLDLEPLLRCSNYSVSEGREAIEKLLQLPEPPDAFVASNNLWGVGAIQVLIEADLAPPAVGMAVVGLLPFETLYPLVVTSIKLPVRQMGKTAASMLLARIAGDRQASRTVVLRNEIQSEDWPRGGH